MLKKIVKNLKPSSTLLINETSKKLEDQGKKIFKFGFGQSPFKVPEDVVEELKNKLGRGRAKKGMFEGDLKEGELEIGQAASQLTEVLPAAEIIGNILDEFKLAMSVSNRNFSF